MLKNYLKITIRNLIKNKLYTFVNIIGLATGVVCFILISLFIVDELNYDTQNINADRIFRINTKYKVGDNSFNIADSPLPLARVLVDECPEIEKAVRLEKADEVYIKKGDEFIKEEKFFYSDSTLFDIFTIEFLSGIPNTALTKPNSIVITNKIAEKYFGSKNPVGERLITSNRLEFLVTGVVKSVPHNSHFEFDFIASFNTLPAKDEANWFGKFVHIYVLTNKGVTEKQLNDKIYSITEKHVGPIIKGIFGVSYEEFINKGNDFSFTFFPLKKIHLYSEMHNEFKESGNINTVYLFTAIAILLILIACINFINLTTAKSTRRANEIGVRKVLGSSKTQLVKQFLSESIVICFAAVAISLVIVEVVLPYFNALTNKELSVNYFGEIYVIPMIIIFTLILGITAGIYPALLLSNKPVLVLKGKSSSLPGRMIFKSANKNMLRRGLVIFQFSASIILFIGTFVIHSQMDYIRNSNPGMNVEQVLVINNINALGPQQFAFANAVKENSNVLNASLSLGLPMHTLSANIFQKEGESSENHTLIILPADYKFLETYKLSLKEGRYFSKDVSTDTLSIVLNETAVRKLGLRDPLNSVLLSNIGVGESASHIKIIGVVKDFHLMTFKDEIRPAALVLLRRPEATTLSVKVSQQNVKYAIEYISKLWKEFGKSEPLEYSFFDESYGELYRAEIKTSKVFTIFSILAIVIACLGLFSLSAFTAEQRTKEIGIRKVLGATTANMVLMLSKESLILVALGNIIAWPTAYFLMNRWLEDFVYKINISVEVFLISGLVVLVIALITVSFQAIKAAVSNPIESIKYE